MLNSAKVWLFSGIGMIVLGCIIFALAVVSTKGDFKSLFSGKINFNEYEITENFSNLSLDVETADIRFESSDSDKCVVSIQEPEKVKHVASVIDDTLTVSYDDEREWYDRIGFFAAPTITVKLPRGEYNAITIRSTTGNITLAKDFIFDSIDIQITTGKINCYASATTLAKFDATTGNVFVENASFGSVEVEITTGDLEMSNLSIESTVFSKVTTGEVEIKNLSCKGFSSSGTTGDLRLINVIASETLFAKRSTGDVEIDGIDAPNIELQTSTGDIEGTILSCKTFIYSSGTGKVSLPQNTDGGECKLTTSTGDIKIRIK